MEKTKIGIFDSGVGGLTVLAALKNIIKTADFIYFGDTARLPYGSKSKESILKYSIEAVNFLLSQHVDMIVVACNTATSISLSVLMDKFQSIPIIGVIKPGSEVAVRKASNGKIAVIATNNTINMKAYDFEMRMLSPDLQIVSKACPLLVSLAEEGWVADKVAKTIVKKYLKSIMKEFEPYKPDCLVLGCTHFPFFRDIISDVVGPDVEIVDSAESTAMYIRDNYFKFGENISSSDVFYYVTDSPERFVQAGRMLLGDDISRENVYLVPLEELCCEDVVNLKACVDVLTRYNSNFVYNQNKILYDKVNFRIMPLLKNIELLSKNNRINLYVEDIKKVLLSLTFRYPDKFKKISNKFSPSERLVSELIIEGLSSKDIASKLNLSISTVHCHRRNIRKKLGIDRSENSLRSFFFEEN